MNIIIEEETAQSSSSNDLSINSIRENLTCLGKNPFSFGHAYLALNVTGKNVRHIENIRDYPHLMYIDVSDNLIDDLKPLESLIALVQLTARNNQLVDCLTFVPKRCTSNSAWPGGQKAVGSMLALVDLTGNQITVVDNLCHHKFLECLILSSNKILEITGLQSLKYLQVVIDY
jgi:Leucine-rich repeat (LRR) protein